MARLTNKQRIVSLRTKGRVGFPSSFGNALCGYNRLGLDDELCGIYQTATFLQGKDTQIQRFYFPGASNTDAQALRRSRFRDGVSAYRALTSDQLADINRKGKTRRMTGYNYFLSRWLRAG